MFDKQRLGKDGTEASRPCQPDDGDNQMNQKDEDIAHPGTVSAWYQNPKKHLILAHFSNSPWTPVSDPGGCLICQRLALAVVLVDLGNTSKEISRCFSITAPSQDLIVHSNRIRRDCR